MTAEIQPRSGRTVQIRLRLGGHERIVDVGEILVATALLAAVLWHFWVTWSASARTGNLLLVAPATGLFVVLWGLIVLHAIQPRGGEPERPSIGLRVVGLVGLFGLYVAALPLLGFDGATAAFTACCMLLLGERNLLAISTYSAALGVALGWIMVRGVSSDAPSLLF